MGHVNQVLDRESLRLVNQSMDIRLIPVEHIRVVAVWHCPGVHEGQRLSIDEYRQRIAGNDGQLN